MATAPWQAQLATDVMFLGTADPSLGGHNLAQPAERAVPVVALLREGPRLHFIDKDGNPTGAWHDKSIRDGAIQPRSPMGLSRPRFALRRTQTRP